MKQANIFEKLMNEKLILFILLLGFFVRIYAVLNTRILNPDALLYIYQAKAMYIGDFGSIFGCLMPNISLVPIFTAACYSIVRDWELAAMLVSLFFGSATLIPVAMCCRSRFSSHASAVALSVYAFLPVLVSRSADVLRDPFYWFFLAWSFYFLIKWYDNIKSSTPAEDEESSVQKKALKFLPSINDCALILSGICFILASLSRIEGIVFYFMAGAFPLFTLNQKKIKSLLFFFAPIILIAVAGITLEQTSNFDFSQRFKIDPVISKLKGPISTHAYLVEELERLRVLTDPTEVSLFIEMSKGLIGYVALVVIINRILEGYFYYFLIIFFAGFIDFKASAKKDKTTLYFLLCILASFPVLYIQVLDCWVIEYRHLAGMIMSSWIFFGLGAERILSYFSRKFPARKNTPLVILLTFIIVMGLGKNLKTRGEEWEIYKDVGIYLSQNYSSGKNLSKELGKKPDSEIKVISTSYFPLFVHFYSNLESIEPYCHRDTKLPLLFEPDSPGLTIARLKAKKMDFMILEEKLYKKEDFPKIENYIRKTANVIHEWKDFYGRRILLVQI